MKYNNPIAILADTMAAASFIDACLRLLDAGMGETLSTSEELLAAMGSLRASRVKEGVYEAIVQQQDLSKARGGPVMQKAVLCAMAEKYTNELVSCRTRARNAARVAKHRKGRSSEALQSEARDESQKETRRSGSEAEGSQNSEKSDEKSPEKSEEKSDEKSKNRDEVTEADWDYEAAQAKCLFGGHLLLTDDVSPEKPSMGPKSPVQARFHVEKEFVTVRVRSVWWGLVAGCQKRRREPEDSQLFRPLQKSKKPKRKQKQDDAGKADHTFSYMHTPILSDIFFPIHPYTFSFLYTLFAT